MPDTLVGEALSSPAATRRNAPLTAFISEPHDNFKLDLQIATIGECYDGAASGGSGAEVLRPHILRAVQHAQDHDAVGIGTVVDTAFPIWKSAQPLRDMIARRPGEIHFGNPGNLGGKISHKLARIVRACPGDISPDFPQILDRERGNDKSFSTNGLSFRS